MTSRTAAAQASAVSRLLRNGGLNPLSSGTPFVREGVRVSGSIHYIRVVVDIDAPGNRARMGDAIAELLTAAGRTFERSDDDGFVRFQVEPVNRP